MHFLVTISSSFQEIKCRIRWVACLCTSCGRSDYCPWEAALCIYSLVLTLLSVLRVSFCRCSSGYRGNPQMPGGTCQRCDCSPHGSVHSDCDRGSGQCVCRPGATGLHCEDCEPRHILVESDCVCGYHSSQGWKVVSPLRWFPGTVPSGVGRIEKVLLYFN